MTLLNEYFRLQQDIYDYFGYVEDWVVIPLDDRTSYYWKLELESKGVKGTEEYVESGYVWYAKNRDFVVIEEGNDEDGYKDDIYHQRFLPKAVYRGDDYTMIVVDTHTDGNRFLAIYSNDKEVKL